LSNFSNAVAVAKCATSMLWVIALYVVYKPPCLMQKCILCTYGWTWQSNFFML